MNQSLFANVNGIRLHYLDYGGSGQPLILMHGLSANAWMLDPLAQRLSPRFRVYAVDLRGRGLSDKPLSGYAMDDHARDIVGLMDVLGIQQAVVIGHSFGGLVVFCLAAFYPQRISKAISLDAGIMHPNVGELIAPSIDRLKQTWPSWDAYLKDMQQVPYLWNNWDPDMLTYHRADVEIKADGTVVPRISPDTIVEIRNRQVEINWVDIFQKIKQPVLLVNAPGPYGYPDAPALMPVELAQRTIGLLAHGRRVEVPGNHVTMMYNQGAQAIAEAIAQFVNEA